MQNIKLTIKGFIFK